MNKEQRKKAEVLIERLRNLERDASGSNMANFAYGEELSRRRVALEKQLLDQDLDQFYQEIKEQ